VRKQVQRVTNSLDTVKRSKAEAKSVILIRNLEREENRTFK
jgi:BMFP domain-containing protein YqiC